MIQRRANRSFLSYIDLSREYYAAHGYTKPYQWISHQNKIPTVVVGSARDVVEECGVARFLFTDFPLGNPFGKPWDKKMQRSIMDMALELLQFAWQPRTTVQTPFIWSEDETWRKVFMHVSEEQREAYKKAGEARRAEQANVKEKLKKKD